jgi:hypothetical protein
MFLLGARAGLWRLRALGIEILFLGGTTLRKREKRGVGLTTRVGWRSVECLSWVKAGCRRQVNVRPVCPQLRKWRMCPGTLTLGAKDRDRGEVPAHVHCIANYRVSAFFLPLSPRRAWRG